MNKRNFLCVFFLGALLSSAGADIRKEPMDIFLILDIPSIKTNREEALEWVCANVIDRVVQEGDRLSVWSASEKTELIFQDTISGTLRENVKETVRALHPAGSGEHYAAALGEADRRVRALPAARLSYTLVVSGVGHTQDSVPEGISDLMRYAKTSDFSGWRAVVVGLGINAKVREAAVSYINTPK